MQEKFQHATNAEAVALQGRETGTLGCLSDAMEKDCTGKRSPLPFESVGEQVLIGSGIVDK